jgi:hypothetical protein
VCDSTSSAAFKFRILLATVAAGAATVTTLACDSRAASAPGADAGVGSDADADVAADAAQAVPLTDLPAAVGQAICERRWSCCSVDEREAAGFAPDQATCADRLAVAFNLLLPELQASIARDRASYDGAALGRCLRATTASPCTTARAGVPPEISLAGCPYLVAKVPLGAPCGQGFECVAGYCSGVRVNADGTCMPKKPDGASCETLDECRSNNCDLDAEVCAPAVARPLCVVPD